MTPRTLTQPPQNDQASRLRAIMAAAHAHESNSPAPEHHVVRLPQQRVPKRPLVGARQNVSIVAIASGKGGVGKSSLAVSLASTLTRNNKRVTLLDGDVGLANTDVLCGVRVRQHLGHVLDGTCDASDVCITTPQGFRLVPGASGLANIVQAADNRPSALMQRLAPITNDTDILLIDCGAGISRIVRAFLAAADLPIVVATPEPTSITDAYALLKITASDRAKRAHLRPVPALYINMAQDEKHARQVHKRIAQVCERFVHHTPELLGWCPTDPSLPRSVHARIPVVIHEPKSKASKAIKKTSRALSQHLVGQDSHALQGGFFARMWRGLHRL
ncbi:MAG: MinD/ParA family protein [Planctomycetota bacterium]|jgi:flagellar biosynthesis protein FlhG